MAGVYFFYFAVSCALVLRVSDAGCVDHFGSKERLNALYSSCGTLVSNLTVTSDISVHGCNSNYCDNWVIRDITLYTPSIICNDVELKRCQQAFLGCGTHSGVCRNDFDRSTRDTSSYLTRRHRNFRVSQSILIGVTVAFVVFIQGIEIMYEAPKSKYTL